MAIQSAFGAQLARGDGGSPEVFTPIAFCQNIDGMELTLDTTEVTNHQSPGGWEEKVPTILRSGEVGLKLYWDKSQPTHTALVSDQFNRVKRNYRLIFPDAGVSTFGFAAFVTKFKWALPIDDALAADVTISPTGAVTGP